VEPVFFVRILVEMGGAITHKFFFPKILRDPGSAVLKVITFKTCLRLSIPHVTEAVQSLQLPLKFTYKNAGLRAGIFV